MAQQLEEIQKFGEQLKKNTTCPICLGWLKSPASGECLHKFCMECILRQISVRRKPKCPVCNKPISKRSLKASKEFEPLLEHVEEILTNLNEEVSLDSGVPLIMFSQRVKSPEKVVKLPPPKTPVVFKKKALSTETPVGSKSNAVAVTPARPWGGTAKKKSNNKKLVSKEGPDDRDQLLSVLERGDLRQKRSRKDGSSKAKPTGSSSAIREESRDVPSKMQNNTTSSHSPDKRAKEISPESEVAPSLVDAEGGQAAKIRAMERLNQRMKIFQDSGDIPGSSLPTLNSSIPPRKPSPFLIKPKFDDSPSPQVPSQVSENDSLEIGAKRATVTCVKIDDSDSDSDGQRVESPSMNRKYLSRKVVKPPIIDDDSLPDVGMDDLRGEETRMMDVEEPNTLDILGASFSLIEKTIPGRKKISIKNKTLKKTDSRVDNTVFEIGKNLPKRRTDSPKQPNKSLPSDSGDSPPLKIDNEICLAKKSGNKSLPKPFQTEELSQKPVLPSLSRLRRNGRKGPETPKTPTTPFTTQVVQSTSTVLETPMFSKAQYDAHKTPCLKTPVLSEALSNALENPKDTVLETPMLTTNLSNAPNTPKTTVLETPILPKALANALETSATTVLDTPLLSKAQSSALKTPTETVPDAEIVTFPPGETDVHNNDNSNHRKRSLSSKDNAGGKEKRRKSKNQDMTEHGREKISSTMKRHTNAIRGYLNEVKGQSSYKKEVPPHKRKAAVVQTDYYRDDKISPKLTVDKEGRTINYTIEKPEAKLTIIQEGEIISPKMMQYFYEDVLEDDPNGRQQLLDSLTEEEGRQQQHSELADDHVEKDQQIDSLADDYVEKGQRMDSLAEVDAGKNQQIDSLADVYQEEGQQIDSLADVNREEVQNSLAGGVVDQINDKDESLNSLRIDHTALIFGSDFCDKSKSNHPEAKSMNAGSQEKYVQPSQDSLEGFTYNQNEFDEHAFKKTFGIIQSQSDLSTSAVDKVDTLETCHDLSMERMCVPLTPDFEAIAAIDKDETSTMVYNDIPAKKVESPTPEFGPISPIKDMIVSTRVYDTVPERPSHATQTPASSTEQRSLITSPMTRTSGGSEQYTTQEIALIEQQLMENRAALDRLHQIQAAGVAVSDSLPEAGSEELPTIPDTLHLIRHPPTVPDTLVDMNNRPVVPDTLVDILYHPTVPDSRPKISDSLPDIGHRPTVPDTLIEVQHRPTAIPLECDPCPAVLLAHTKVGETSSEKDSQAILFDDPESQAASLIQDSDSEPQLDQPSSSKDPQDNVPDADTYGDNGDEFDDEIDVNTLQESIVMNQVREVDPNASEEKQISDNKSSETKPLQIEGASTRILNSLPQPTSGTSTRKSDTIPRSQPHSNKENFPKPCSSKRKKGEGSPVILHKRVSRLKREYSQQPRIVNLLLAKELDSAARRPAFELRRHVRESCNLHIRILTEFTEQVTHLVFPHEERMFARSTHKYMLALAHGTWILSSRWLEESWARKELLNEEPFELQGDDTNRRTGAPRAARLAKLLRQPPLFTNLTVRLIGDMVLLPREDLCRLLELMGVNIISGSGEEGGASEPSFRTQSKVTPLIDRVEEERASWVEEAGEDAITVQWILTCLCSYRVLPISY